MTLRLVVFPLVILCLARSPVVSAAPQSKSADTIFRLDDLATFQEGCFDPCDCKLMDEMEIRGAFVLGPAIIGNAVNFHEVSDIHWRVIGEDGSVIHTITGSGVYRISNFGPPLFHDLYLELSIDGLAPRIFFSDFVKVPNDGSLDLLVSINGIFCYDIVIRVDASAVRSQEITSYRLDAESNYQQGCFDGSCSLEQPRPMTGSFMLVPLVDQGTFSEFGIVRLDFAVAAIQGNPAIGIHGTGNYTLIQGFAGPIQAMDLRLSIDGQPLTSFDQELENTATIFPSIDIAVDMNDQVGDDIVLTMIARPILPGDVNLDGTVSLLDVAPFVELLASGDFQPEADINGDGFVNLLDIQPFVDLLTGG